MGPEVSEGVGSSSKASEGGPRDNARVAISSRNGRKEKRDTACKLASCLGWPN